MTFDKLVERHKNPLNQLFHLLGFIGVGVGLWEHSWEYISIGAVLLLLGHLFPLCKKKKRK